LSKLPSLSPSGRKKALRRLLGFLFGVAAREICVFADGLADLGHGADHLGVIAEAAFIEERRGAASPWESRACRAPLRRSEACVPIRAADFRVGLGFLEPAFALFGDGADELLVAVSDDLLRELAATGT
jgi:hypothetical protein